MTQAPCLDGLALYLLALLQDLRRTAVIGIGGCNVAEALMVAAVVVMVDEGGDLLLEIAGQEVIFKQDAVFQRLMPSFDFALGLGMARRASYVFDISAVQPFGQITCDITRPIIGEQARLMLNFG